MVLALLGSKLAICLIQHLPCKGEWISILQKEFNTLQLAVWS